MIKKTLWNVAIYSVFKQVIINKSIIKICLYTYANVSFLWYSIYMVFPQIQLIVHYGTFKELNKLAAFLLIYICARDLFYVHVIFRRANRSERKRIRAQDQDRERHHSAQV